MSPENASAHIATRTPEEVVRTAPAAQAPNGVCFAAAGETAISGADLERLVNTVPKSIAAALDKRAFYFVPLTVNQDESTVIADQYSLELSDKAVCHRNIALGGSQCVFISTRLMDDKFSVAFEFFINVGHIFVEKAGVSQQFSDVVCQQVEAGVKGETSLDANDLRRQAWVRSTESGRQWKVSDEKAKSNFLSATFSDSIAIYLLSLYLDVDYWDLREREYPLLAPAAMAERIKKVHELFPQNAGYDFNVFYRRRSQ